MSLHMLAIWQQLAIMILQDWLYPLHSIYPPDSPSEPALKVCYQAMNPGCRKTALGRALPTATVIPMASVSLKLTPLPCSAVQNR
jgi:hypothetical protein